VFDPLAHHFGHERVQAKRGSNQITNIRVLACGGCGESRDVFVPMAARQQEVWEDNDGRRSTFNTAT
jgi:hypothetical protein